MDTGVLLLADKGLATDNSPVPAELPRLCPVLLPNKPPLLLGLLLFPCNESSLYSSESSVIVRMCLGIKGQLFCSEYEVGSGAVFAPCKQCKTHANLHKNRGSSSPSRWAG